MVSNLLVTSNCLRILLKVGVEVSSILVAGIGSASSRQSVIFLIFIQTYAVASSCAYQSPALSKLSQAFRRSFDSCRYICPISFSLSAACLNLPPCVRWTTVCVKAWIATTQPWLFAATQQQTSRLTIREPPLV